MLKLTQQTRVVCCCSAGQVRSVAARKIMQDTHGMPNVLAIGLDKNGAEILERLFDWAEVIVIVGETSLLEKLPGRHRGKAVHFDVGIDRWHNPFDGGLAELLQPRVAELFQGITFLEAISCSP